jgi:hypothetical protein
LLDFGFRKLTETEIKRRNEERALACSPIETERKTNEERGAKAES